MKLYAKRKKVYVGIRKIGIKRKVTLLEARKQ